MKIVRGPSTGLLFTVVVLGVLGLGMGQECDQAINSAATICGITCDISFSQTNIFSRLGVGITCFCKEKVGGTGMLGDLYVDTRNCKEGSSSCPTTTCPDGTKLYRCPFLAGSDAESAKEQPGIKLCACGTEPAA